MARGSGAQPRGPGRPGGLGVNGVSDGSLVSKGPPLGTVHRHDSSTGSQSKAHVRAYTPFLELQPLWGLFIPSLNSFLSVHLGENQIMRSAEVLTKQSKTTI